MYNRKKVKSSEDALLYGRSEEGLFNVPALCEVAD